MPKGSRRTPKGRRHPKGAPDEIGEALEYAEAMEESVETGAKMGAPTKFKRSMLTVVKRHAKAGLTEREIAFCMGISLRTVTTWKAEHPDFLRALQPGKEAANKRVEASLFHRAIGYSYDVSKTIEKEGEEPVVVTQEVHYPPEVGAAKLWLTNRDEKRWKDLKSTELSTPPGRPLEFAPTLPTEHEAAAAYAQRILAAASGRRTDSRSLARVGTDRRSGPGSSGSEDAGEG
jgi:hypothetical protein